MKTVLVDIDGTVADLEHRKHLVRSKPKNWPAFNRAIPNDSPIHQTITVVNALKASGMQIVFCSGRGSESREVTEAWLRDVAKFDFPLVLFMRAERDNRSDDIVKSELLDQIIAEGFDPQFVIDDRPKVVRMWRARGLFVFDVNQSGEEF